MYADCEGDIYVELCDEDQEDGEGKTMCGQLVKAMCGTRPAANMWQKDGTKTLTDAGFWPGKISPCIFHQDSRSIMTSLRGGDFVSWGSLGNQNFLEGVLKGKYSIKTTAIGEDEKLAKRLRILNRIVR